MPKLDYSILSDSNMVIKTIKTRGCLNSLTWPFSFLLLVFAVVSY